MFRGKEDIGGHEQQNGTVILIFRLDVATVEPPFCNNSVTSLDEFGLYMDYIYTVTLKEVLLISEEALGPIV
mgnify:CR=1 FL=1